MNRPADHPAELALSGTGAHLGWRRPLPSLGFTLPGSVAATPAALLGRRLSEYHRLTTNLHTVHTPGLTLTPAILAPVTEVLR